MVLCATQTVAGEYFSLLKIIVMLVLAIPWLMISPWIHRDAKQVLAPVAAWSGGVLAAGAVSLLVWMIVPYYVIGLLLYLAAIGSTVGSYIVYRNAKCDPADKIMTATFFSSLMGQHKAKQIDLIARAKIYASTGRIVTVPGDDSTTSEKLAYNGAQNLLYDLVFRRASEADLAPSGQLAKVKLVIDGVAAQHEPLDLALSQSIIQYLKGLAGMDVEERRRPQQGKIGVDITDSGRPTDIVLTCAGSTGGQRMQFRMVQEVVRTNLEELGVSVDVLTPLRQANIARSGLIIVSSKPQNGVTSSLYSLLREHDAFIEQLITLESKAVIDLENVTQNQYGSDDMLERALASAIRRDPDVIMIDRCTTPGSAELILRAAESKLVLLGMRAKDSFVAMAKWIKLCGSADAATANLRGVLCQMLLRKLCMDCREPYPPDRKLLAKVNIDAEKIGSFFRKPSGPRVDEKGRPIVCITCQESGYFGRIGAFEYLDMTDEIKALVVSGGDLRRIKSACRKNGMFNLQEQALKKVIEGLTSIREVIRVSQQDKKKS